MRKSLSRIMAIVIKELQDLRSNMGVLPIYIIPLIIVLLYRSVLTEIPAGFNLGFGLLFLANLVGIYGPAVSVAEEKEKNTLEVLLLSPAKPLEIIAGKGLNTFVTAIFAAVIIYFLSGVGEINSPSIFLVGALLMLLTCIFLGMLVGLLAPNQTAAGTIASPVYLVLILFPVLSMGQEHFIETITRVLPTRYFFEMVLYLTDYPEITELNLPQALLIIALGCVVSLFLLSLAIKKRGLAK